MIDKRTLSQFSGTENWHRYNPIMPNVLLTDGALYVATEGGAFWLMDIIGSAQLNKRVKGEAFQVWTLRVSPDNSALVTCEDGNGEEVYRQAVPFTDFELYASSENGYLIVLLPGEY